MTTFRSFSSHIITAAAALALSITLISGTVSVPSAKVSSTPASEFVA